MNSDQNFTAKQLFENSEPTIKQDLRVGPCEEVIQRALESLGALAILNRNIERLERERYVGANVSIGYIT